jgi:multidrug efflux pump subunit AcrA (membrane-fusion protein)
MFSFLRIALPANKSGSVAVRVFLVLLPVSLLGGPLVAQSEQATRPRAVAEKPPEVALHKVARGDLIVMVEERGVIESMQNTPVTCRLRSFATGSTISSTIKWVIDDGSQVKKGDKLVELDDSGLREIVRTQEVVVAGKRAELERALKERDLVQEKGKLEVGTAEDNLEIAEIELKDSEEKDKRKMEARLRQAKRAVQLAKLQAATAREQAEAAVAPVKAALIAEQTKLAELKEQLGHCILTAPKDGLAVYNVPEQARWGIGRSTAIAVGEAVREGQVLITLPDLSRFQVVTRVHESLVGRLRPVQGRFKPETAQQATIVADAFPSKVLRGHVQSVASKPEAGDFLSADVKAFSTTIVLAEDPKMPPLKPGMSATVRILVDEKKNVLRIPIQAVLGLRGKRLCFVKRGEGFAPHELVLGVSNDTYVEVKEGLKEGEEVVLNPHALRPPRIAPDRRQSQFGWPRRGDLLVRSVRPDEENSYRRVERYGLTTADLTRFEELVRGLEAVVPARTFSLSVRSPATARSSAVRLVATTPSYAVAHGIDRHFQDEDHRFLADLDGEHFAAVAVLGAEVARELFPGEDPLGQSIALGTNHSFRVVGVLRERRPHADVGIPDNDVYIPLTSCRRLFGKTVLLRKAGAWRAEAIELNEVLLTLRDPEQVPAAAATVRSLLEHYHANPDWEVKVGNAP